MTRPTQTEAVSKPFWEGAIAGRLVVPHCDSCHRWQWPFRYRCGGCGGSMGWKAASGRARLLSWSEVLRPPRPELKAIAPYTIAMVEIEEGARMLTRLQPPVPPDLSAGQSLMCAFESVQADALSFELPVFTVVKG